MEKDMKKSVKPESLFGKWLLSAAAIALAMVILMVFLPYYELREKSLAQINYAVAQIKNNNNDPYVPTLMVDLIHDVVGWGFVSLSNVGLTEKKLQQLAEDSRNRNYAHYKNDPLKIKELHKFHMEYVVAMSERKFKWTDSTTWPKYAYLVNGTTENWKTLTGKEDKDAMEFAKYYLKKTGNLMITVEAPKIESGQYASLSAYQACMIVLPDNPKERNEFLVSGIYYNNGYKSEADYNGSAAIPSRISSGTKYSIVFDPPKKGQGLKIIVYRLTDQEMKDKKP